jgi:hypothetical protein
MGVDLASDSVARSRYTVFHAHILCSTRKLQPEGFTSKTRELDDMKTGAVARLRAEWEFMVNAKLERAGTPSGVVRV